MEQDTKTERKLATARYIRRIEAIEGADKIELAHLDGWQTVVNKGQYKPGDLVTFVEIDSFIPHALAPFLTKDKPKIYQGVEGNKLKTIKLRGTLSQGLVLSPHRTLIDGEDLTEELGIKKWEAEIPAQLAGQVKGNFPSFLRKTDLERIQNMPYEFKLWAACGAEFEVTEKLDGSSMTAYLYEDQFGVCSRNLDLKETEGNAYWIAARKQNLEQLLRDINRPGGIAIQGELIGPGIQGNIYGRKESAFCAFDIFDIATRTYLHPAERHDILQNGRDVLCVPILAKSSVLDPDRLDQFILAADGQSKLNTVPREGIAYKCTGKTSNGPRFKVISNDFLLKEKI